MNIMKKISALAATAVLALAVTACMGNGGSGAPEQPADDSGAAIEQLANVSGYAVDLSEENKQATVEVEVAEGESLYQMSRLDTGEAESSTSHDGEWLTSDYFYEGSGAGMMGVDPGTYTIEVSTEDATGTIWIFAYTSDAVDYESMDADQIVDFLLGEIS